MRPVSYTHLIDFTCNLDTCIAIRIAYAKNGKVFVCAGAGIVADSGPENEYQECLNLSLIHISSMGKRSRLPTTVKGL